MSWKQFEIKRYQFHMGSDQYHGSVILFGDQFLAYLRFHKQGPLPDSAPQAGSPPYSQRYVAHLDHRQMDMIVDTLRNEKPIYFSWHITKTKLFRLITGGEPVGEEEEVDVAYA